MTKHYPGIVAFRMMRMTAKEVRTMMRMTMMMMMKMMTGTTT